MSQKEDFKITVEENTNNGTWDVAGNGMTAISRRSSAASKPRRKPRRKIPGFHERVDQEFEKYSREADAKEAEENERYPNLAHVRNKIKKLRDNKTPADMAKAWDASDKLERLLDMDLAPHITWPLPSWPAIKSGRVYNRR